VSRIGRLPVVVPETVQVTVLGSDVTIKGPKGEMHRAFSPRIHVAHDKDARQIIVTRENDEPTARALHGTTRALIQNMVTGVSTGFTITLEIDGVGYRAEMDGETLVLNLGFSHPVRIEPAAGVSFETDTKTRQIRVMGYDREVLGQIAADIRKLRPPEPYLGKGIHYLGERIRRKAGKAGKGKGAKK